MKKIIINILTMTMLFVLLGGCKNTDKIETSKNTESINIEETIIEEETTEEETMDPILLKVENTIASMTLEEKIAQMLILNFDGQNVDGNLSDIVANVKPGGYILMGHNMSTYDNTCQLVEDLKGDGDIPVIISIDQEGGMVQRMLKLTDVKPTDIPDMFDVGATEDETLAYDIGKVIATELRTIGVNLTYAPVVDILTEEGNTVIGKRSFGVDSQTVSKMSVSLAKGLEDNGVLSTYKHFPGHGDTVTDSHTALPIIRKSKEQLWCEELMPFDNAIKNGANMIMIGHIALPEITGDNVPASLSKVIITDLLKNEMNYDGLVITDALNMGALINNYTDEEIYVKAVNAGVDLLLMPRDFRKAISSIKENISEERINESVKKILTYKYTYLPDYEKIDKEYLGCDEHESVINRVYE